MPTRGNRGSRRRGAGPGFDSVGFSVTRVRSRPDSNEFRASLTGFEEVPPILTGASGSFSARVSPGGESLQYELTFRNLSTPSTAAHIHFAQRGVNGPIIAFLCGGNGKPDCPERGGTVRGEITRDDIRAIPEQGLAAGDFAGFLRILRAGAAYVNVHSTQYPNGEIRGQIRERDDD